MDKISTIFKISKSNSISIKMDADETSYCEELENISRRNDTVLYTAYYWAQKYGPLFR